METRNKQIDLLDKYTTFLQKNGYIDTDATCEEPFAIDEFLKTLPKHQSHSIDKTSEEHIICAANYYNDGQKYEMQPKGIATTGFVVCGHRHHNCIFIFAKIVGFPYDENGLRIMRTEVQGFLTNTNRFVTRLKALEIAKKANQIITGEGSSSLGLFSEDLY